MELYHVLNRGVDKRTIFLDDQDHQRFVVNLSVMNDTRPVENLGYLVKRSSATSIDLVSRYNNARERLVNIHGWCLMGNHYHLLLSERQEGGITAFIRKLNVGYAKYFNERYDRSGTLFQGRTKRVLIERDAHFLWILLYIHFNPLDFLKGAGDWRTQRLTNRKKALNWIEKYRWSSYRDYLGRGDYAPILAGSWMFEDRRAHVKEAKRYLAAVAETPTSVDALE